MSDKSLISELKKKNRELEEKISNNLTFFQEEIMISRALQIINKSNSFRELIGQILTLFKEWSLCEAVGIRIKEGDDYPYFVTNGFPDDFVELERFLCEYNNEGNVILDMDGNPDLGCMCGNILCGRYNPEKSFFTSDGSFFSNCTTELLATTTDEDRQARTRNRCNGFGYESVALIPLRSGGETFGLIQLNDHEKGKFTTKLIGSYRRAANYIATYLAKKQVDEALITSEHLTRTLIDSLPDLVWLKDIYGKYITCNKRFERLFGAEEKDIIGKTDYDFVDKNLADFFIEHDHQSIDAGTSMVNEEEVTFKSDGHKEILETIKTPLYNSNNQVFGVLGIGRDITKHKLSEESLRKSKEQLYLFFKNTPAAVAMFDRDMRYIAVSNRWITDYDLDELSIIGRSHYDIFPDIPDHWKVVHQLGMKGKITKVSEECFPRKDGSDQWIMWEVRPWYDSIGQIGGIIILTEDITQKKETEAERNRFYEQLVQSQKMESVGRLAGGVAHDLNNLLTPILGYSEILLDELENDDGISHDALSEIIKASIRARDIVKQLLAFSRKQTLEIHAVKLNDVIENFKKLLRRTISENIEMAFVLSADVSPVLADIGLIEQVLMNLSINASDAMPNGGLLSIETKQVYLDSNSLDINGTIEPGHYVMLSVSDTGVGIKEEILDHIFDPFYTTKGDMGTGLGLSTVFGIVKQHYGYIKVYSELGQGSAFKIFLPVTKELITKNHSEEFEDSGTGWETILLVEDNDGVRSITESLLRKMNYTVLSVGSGEEALKLIDTYHDAIHLMLTDIVLTGINGIELHNIVESLRPGIRILYMSGYTKNIIYYKERMDGNFNFIQKPFSKKELIVKVRNVLNSEI